MVIASRGALVGSALLAVAAGQPPPVWIGLAIAGAVAAAARWIPRFASLLLAVAVALAAWRELPWALPLGLGWLLAHRALAARGFERGIVLVTALMVISGLSGEPRPLAWGAAAVWSGALPLALLEVRRFRAVFALWAPLAALATAGLYLVVPRLREVPVARDAPPVTGFAPEVELGRSDGPVDHDAVVLRVRPAVPGPLYLRGMVLDRFDGRKWTTALDPAFVTPPTAEGPRFEVLATRPESAAFTAGTLRALHADGVARTSSGTWMFADPLWGWAFRADPPYGPGARVEGPPPRDVDEALPPDLDPRIRRLAGDLGTGRAAIDGVVRKLSGWRYSRAPARVTRDPLGTFLFDRRAGHCEHFASATGVLLRAAGLPTRVITGYASAEVEGDAWVVRRRHAHAWVEVWIDGAWEAVDATPGPYAASSAPRPDPRELVDRWADWDRAGWTRLLRSAGPVVAIGIALAGGLAVLRRRRRAPVPPTDPVERAWWAARADLLRHGWDVPRSLPPLAAARWVAARAADADAGEALVALAWLLYDHRWGGADPAASSSTAQGLAARAARIGPPGPEPSRTEIRRADAERAGGASRL